MIKSILSQMQQKMLKTLERLSHEFSSIRTGRASPAILDAVRVDYYGQPVALAKVATIGVPEPRMLEVRPWDVSILAEIEKAILKSQVGITPMNDGKVIRLPMPPMTDETRGIHTKTARKVAEDHRVILRGERREAMEEIKKLKSDRKISEDDVRIGEREVQKIADSFLKKIDETLSRKESEISEI